MKALRKSSAAGIRATTLGFQPMALGSFSSLLQAKSLPQQWPKSSSELRFPRKEIAELGGPLFVSPKHDGIRLLSVRHQSGSDISCFSRFGRPLRGLFWIEDELDTLRRVCGDPHVCLDGELYLHRQSVAAAPGQPCKAQAEKCSGFAAVSSLVTTLRGQTSTAPNTLEGIEALGYGVPRYCVFDVAQYRPTAAPINCSLDEQRAVESVMHLCGISDLRTLSVVPNEAPFVARIRTLNFLFYLLSIVCKRSSDDAGATTPASTSVNHSLAYKGGAFVRMIPYEVLPEILQATAKMQLYNRIGFEGAVVRTGMSRYHCMRSKAFRSACAVKLLPHYEDEFVILNIEERQGEFWGLKCANAEGKTLCVPLSHNMTSEERADLLRQLIGSRSSRTNLVGTFVTLQYPSLTSNGLPRFPKIKGIRGGSGWFL